MRTASYLLDLKTWLDRQEVIKIVHEFYKKPMSSKFTLRNGTAYPRDRLKAVLIEEVTRRLRNCTPEMDWTSKGKFLTEYAKEMKNSGHDERFRTEIMERAVGKYKKMLDEHERGVKCMYRTREERQTEIEKRGGNAGQDSWFRKKNDNQREKRTSVLRVPYTGGE